MVEGKPRRQPRPQLAVVALAACLCAAAAWLGLAPLQGPARAPPAPAHTPFSLPLEERRFAYELARLELPTLVSKLRRLLTAQLALAALLNGVPGDFVETGGGWGHALMGLAMPLSRSPSCRWTACVRHPPAVLSAVSAAPQPPPCARPAHPCRRLHWRHLHPDGQGAGAARPRLGRRRARGNSRGRSAAVGGRQLPGHAGAGGAGPGRQRAHGVSAGGPGGAHVGLLGDIPDRAAGSRQQAMAQPPLRCMHFWSCFRGPPGAPPPFVFALQPPLPCQVQG